MPRCFAPKPGAEGVGGDRQKGEGQSGPRPAAKSIPFYRIYVLTERNHEIANCQSQGGDPLQNGHNGEEECGLGAASHNLWF